MILTNCIDQGLQELQSGPVFISIMETFAGELMASEAQESLLSILLSLVKTRTVRKLLMMVLIF